MVHYALRANAPYRDPIVSVGGPSAAMETLAPEGPRLVATGERSGPVEAVSPLLEPRKGRQRSLIVKPSVGATVPPPLPGRDKSSTTFSTGFAALTRGYSPGPLRGPCPDLMAHRFANWLSAFGLGGGKSLGCVGQAMQPRFGDPARRGAGMRKAPRTVPGGTAPPGEGAAAREARRPGRPEGEPDDRPRGGSVVKAAGVLHPRAKPIATASGTMAGHHCHGEPLKPLPASATRCGATNRWCSARKAPEERRSPPVHVWFTARRSGAALLIVLEGRRTPKTPAAIGSSQM